MISLSRLLCSTTPVTLDLLRYLSSVDILRLSSTCRSLRTLLHDDLAYHAWRYFIIPPSAGKHALALMRSVFPMHRYEKIEVPYNITNESFFRTIAQACVNLKALRIAGESKQLALVLYLLGEGTLGGLDRKLERLEVGPFVRRLSGYQPGDTIPRPSYRGLGALSKCRKLLEYMEAHHLSTNIGICDSVSSLYHEGDNVLVAVHEYDIILLQEEMQLCPYCNTQYGVDTCMECRKKLDLPCMVCRKRYVSGELDLDAAT